MLPNAYITKIKTSGKASAVKALSAAGVLFLFVSLLSFSAFHFHPSQGVSACTFSDKPASDSQNGHHEQHCPVCKFKASLSKVSISAAFIFQTTHHFSEHFYGKLHTSFIPQRVIHLSPRAPPTHLG